MNKRSRGTGSMKLKFLTLFGAVFLLCQFSSPQKAHAACGFDTIGDYTCAGGGAAASPGPGPGFPGGGNTQYFIEDFLPSIPAAASCPALLGLPAIISSMPSVIQSALSARLTAFLSSASNCSNITDLITNLLFLQGVFEAMPADPCGVGDTTGNDSTTQAFQVLLYNMIAQDLTWSTNILSSDIATLSTDICSGTGPGTLTGTQPFDPTGPDGPGPGVPPTGPTGPVDDSAVGGEPLGLWCGAAGAVGYATDPNISGTYYLSETDPGRRLAESAMLSIDATTADDNAVISDGGTPGGYGCALAVSRMLRCAGITDIGYEISTITLATKLGNSSCFNEVDTGYIGDFALQPGDVLVTQRGPGGPGHTGIYVGNGQIVSNSSEGFTGSDGQAYGGVKQNYSVGGWDRTVSSRNPTSARVFRPVC